MKHRVFCVVVFLWCVGTTTLNAQDTLILSGGSQHPMAIVSTRLLTEAYRRLGIEIETRELPVARSLYMANAGDVDGELFRGVLNEKDFPNLIRIPVALAYAQLVVFTTDAEFEVTGWDSLRPYTIGIRIGTKGAEAGTAGMRVESVAHVDQLFKKLALGRNDVVVLPRDVGLMTLKTMKLEGIEGMNLEDIRILEPPLQQDALYHYLHKKHERLIPKITDVLQQMEKEGDLQRIREEAEAELFNIAP